MHRTEPDVVTKEGRVERPDRDRDAFEGLDRGGEPAGEHHPPRVHPDEDDVVGSLVAFNDLVRDTGERPPQVGRVEHTGPEREHATRTWGRVAVGSEPPRGGVSRHAVLP